MADFLLLGIVPGTSIQITFITWLYSLALLTIGMLIISVTYKKQPLFVAAVYFAAWRARSKSAQLA